MRVRPLCSSLCWILVRSGPLYFLSYTGREPAINRQTQSKERIMATKTTKKTAKSKTTKKTASKPTKAAPAQDDDRLKSGRLSSKGMLCLCGCGEKTATDGARFRTGHDARLKGVLGRISAGNKRDDDKIPAEVRPFLQEDGGIVGYTAVFKGSAVKLSKVA